MFASQLLRILQSIPSDVNYETCVSSEQDVTMKENPNATHFDSNFGSKEIYPLNGLTNETSLEERERDGSWNRKFVDEFSTDNQNETRNSTDNEFQKGPFHPASIPNEDADSLSSDTNPDDKKPMSTEHKYLIETDAKCYADKIVLECDTPELMVCYKDIDYHVVKDICVDEWTSVNGKILIEDVDSRCEAVGAFAVEKFTKGVITANEPEMPKLSSESSSDEDTIEDLAQKCETNCGANEETVSDGSEEDSFVDRALPIQEFGTRSFLRSFINSLDDGGTKVVQLPDQKVLSEKSVPVCPAASSGEPTPKDDVPTSSLSYNSKVESKNITFNFKSPTPVVTVDTNDKIEITKEQAVDSTDELDHKNGRDQLPDHKDNDYHDRISDGPVQFSNGGSVNSMKCDSQGVDDSNVLKVKNSNDSVVGREKYEPGESSFSAAGLVSYSGPIGSISFRSDGSATSGKSFAFPVLQSEWNSSPVRMTKANERHFRKHKFWRSGLLCCRF